MKIKKTIGATLACLCTALCVYGGIAFGMASAAINEDLPEIVHIGDVVKIPERDIEFEGEYKRASVRIISPQGGIYSGSELTVEQAGVYTVEYTADFNGTTIVEEERLTSVLRSIDFFTADKFSTVEYAAFSYDETHQGVRFTANSTSKIVYDRIVDLTQFTKEDVLAEFSVDPYVEGSADFTTMTITLTDVENTDNYMTISVRDCGPIDCFGKGVYIKVGGNGQKAGGWQYDTFLTSTGYGTSINSSYRYYVGMAKLYYDYEEKALYASDGFDYRTPGKTLVADLDDAITFGAGTWDGFQSGKVNVSIKIDDLVNSQARVLFKSLGGMDLTKEEHPDKKAPEITVDYEGELCAPNCLVGQTYRLFSAQVQDNLDENVQLYTDVYYQSGTGAAKTDVSVQNGAFVADRAGLYTVTYRAKDVSGNETKTEYSFYALYSMEMITIETTDEDRTATVYDTVTVGGVDSVIASGGNGLLNISCQVFAADGTEVELNTNNAFIPEMIGDYTVKYTASDRFGNEQSVQRTITIKELSKPVFRGEISLPRILIQGFSYTLPKCEVKEMNGAELVDVAVKKYVNGMEIAGDTFVAPAQEFAEVTYVAEGKTGRTEKTLVVPVVDGNEGKDQDKYFYGENVTVTENYDHVALTAQTDAGVLFANPLNVNDLNLSFMYNKTKSNFRALRLVLTDAEDESVSVTFSVYIGEDVTVALPKQTATKVSEIENMLSFTYSNSNRYVKDISNITFGVVTYDDAGKEFNGFSGAVYLEIFFDGVEGESEVYLSSFNNQPLGYRKKNPEKRLDGIEPQIYIQETYAVKQVVGATAIVSAAKAYDVLSQVTSFTVSVIGPQGQTIIAETSANQRYTFLIEDYGVYTITYVAEDSCGNVKEYSSLIRACESERPQLKVDSSSLKNTYKKGSKISVPDIVVSDNGEHVYYDVMLQMPNNEMRILMHYADGMITSRLTKDDDAYESSFKVNDTTFKAEQTGKYILYVFAYDDYYNVTSFAFEFIVS